MTLTLSGSGLAEHLGIPRHKLFYRSKSCGRIIYDSHLDPERVGIWRPTYSGKRFAYYWLDTK